VESKYHLELSDVVETTTRITKKNKLFKKSLNICDREGRPKGFLRFIGKTTNIVSTYLKDLR
jgi:hypothetical protein